MRRRSLLLKHLAFFANGTLVGVLVIFFTEQEVNAVESTLKGAINLQFLAFK